MRADQRDQLLSSNQESDCVHEPKKPKENKAGNLIGRLAALNLGSLGFCFHDQSILQQLEISSGACRMKFPGSTQILRAGAQP